jgi:hypothetical protein
MRYLQGLDALKTWAALGGLFLPQPVASKNGLFLPDAKTANWRHYPT